MRIYQSERREECPGWPPASCRRLPVAVPEHSLGSSGLSTSSNLMPRDRSPGLFPRLLVWYNTVHLWEAVSL